MSHDPAHAQDMPVKNHLPAVVDLVIRDLEERDRIGREKYNTSLQPFNGRDSLIDLYQELLDACMYIRQELYQRGVYK